MMLCRLCLADCVGAKNLFDENDQCTEVYQIMEKYFDTSQLPFEDNKHLIVICMLCWGHIFDFHNFQNFVYESQTKTVDIREGNEECEDIVQELSVGDSDKNINSMTCDLEEENGYSHLSAEGAHSGEKASSDIDFHWQEVNETVEILSSEEAWILENSEDSSIGINIPDSGNEEAEKESTSSKCIHTSSEKSTSEHQVTEQDSSHRYSPTDFEGIDDDTIIAQWKSDLECRICSKEFPLFQLLRNHFRENHPLAKFSVICCHRKFFYRCKLAEHIRCHMNPYPYKCKICNRRFTRKANLISHSHKHQHQIKKVKKANLPIKFYESIQTSADEVCEIEVTTSLNDKVPASIILKESNKLHEDDVVIAQWEPFLICQVCSENFPSFTSLRSHFRQAHPQQTLHVQCCGRKFKYRSSFKDHVKRHIDPHPFKCTFCEKHFSQRANLITHVQDAHNLTQKSTNQTLDELLGQWSQELECAICCQAFVSITLLRHHFRYKHPKKSFYVLCCGYKLKRRWEIESHIRSHLNAVVPNFTCGPCDKCFPSQSALERHQSKSHQDNVLLEQENNIVGDCELNMCVNKLSEPMDITVD